MEQDVLNKPSRYFPNTSLPSDNPIDAHAELLASLDRINTFNPPVQTCSTGWTFHGLYAGPTSVAYLFYRLSGFYPSLIFKGQSLLDWATAYLDLSSSRLARRLLDVDASHCGIANETLAQLALRAVIEQDASLAQQLCAYSTTVNAASAKGSNELLYGRAGYLYLLRIVSSAFKSHSADSSPSSPTVTTLLDRTASETISRILATPQPWTWHGKHYLGAAHGTAGILTQIVLSSDVSTDLSHITAILSDLLNTQLPSGNFPSSLPLSRSDSNPTRDDILVQFCHGGPGLVLSLVSLRPYFPALRERIDAAIARARNDTWQRGLLTKSPSLCHGVAGNALAFVDDPKDNTSGELSLSRFQGFLAWMTSAQLESPARKAWMAEAGHRDDFVGLFTGEAGRAWVWALADARIEGGVLRGGCIGFNDL